MCSDGEPAGHVAQSHMQCENGPAGGTEEAGARESRPQGDTGRTWDLALLPNGAHGCSTSYLSISEHLKAPSVLCSKLEVKTSRCQGSSSGPGPPEEVQSFRWDQGSGRQNALRSSCPTRVAQGASDSDPRAEKDSPGTRPGHWWGSKSLQKQSKVWDRQEQVQSWTGPCRLQERPIASGQDLHEWTKMSSDGALGPRWALQGALGSRECVVVVVGWGG